MLAMSNGITPIGRWPSILFGSEKDVRGRVRSLVRKAWKAATWGSTLTDLEMTDDDGVQELFIGPCKWLVPATEDHWRFYDLRNVLFDVSWGGTLDAVERRERRHRLLLEGLDHLWFAISMIHGTDSKPLPLPGTIYEGYGAMCRDVLAKLVFWLPELQRLEPRFLDFWVYTKRECDEDYRRRTLETLTPEQIVVFEETMLSIALPMWSDPVLNLACSAGWPFDHDRTFKEYKCDIVRLLLDDRVIERVGDRYRLTEQFIAQSRQPPTHSGTAGSS
jgi:hypothetical protein